MAVQDLKSSERNKIQPQVWHFSGVQAGIIMAVAAVAAEFFFDVRPPAAYGICIACHGRDLINSVVNQMAGVHLAVSDASLVFPLLTTLGVVIGAAAAAVLSGEFRWQMPENPLVTFFYGVLVMNFALIAAGCATRLALRTAAGDILGSAGFAMMAGAVIMTTLALRWKARR